MATHIIVTVVNIEIFVMIMCHNMSNDIILLIIISIVSRIADNIQY